MTSIPTNRKTADTVTAAVDPMTERVRACQTRIEHLLEEVLPPAAEVPQRLHAAQRYAALGGGKRLRPLLVYFTGEALGVPAEVLDAPAAAVELIHSYSQVHDDLPAMGHQDLRRGRPATHCAFDEATAILAGDALQVLAFSLLARERPGISPAIRLRTVQILADASGTAGMAGGQALDLGATGRRIGLEELETMHRLKTGALIRASVLMAAACRPDLEPGSLDALDGYAQDMALAFTARADLKQSVCARLQELGPRACGLAWLASNVVVRRV
jgi:farnesyl diphosphate synthase